MLVGEGKVRGREGLSVGGGGGEGVSVGGGARERGARREGGKV